MTGICRQISSPDGHFLAGLVDAEGCFQITPNNGGTAWRCWFTLALRDDDAEVLVELHELTGLGHLQRTPARGTSRPQITWMIQRRSDCLRLAEILERFPLRNRKRAEAEIWARAIRELDQEPRPAALPQLASEIRSLKRYVNPPRSPRTSPPFDDGFASYLGGFFTGEGHLHVGSSRCRATIKLRNDDRALLEDLASATGLGKVYSSPGTGRDAPQVAWIIYRRDQLRDAVRLFERAGLRGRKSREFTFWRPAALELAAAHAERRRPQGSLVSDAAAGVHAERRYRPGPDVAVPYHGERQVGRCLDALRAAAQVTRGGLTVTAYSRLRRDNPDWPNRNTVARIFGSWSNALQAAGLRDRVVRRPRSASPEPAEFSEQELRDRLASRNRIVDTVSRLADRAGRMPTIHEYLAWRTQHDPSLPYLAKVYDLFPGGWSSATRLALH